MKYQFYQVIIYWRSAYVNFQSFSITDRKGICVLEHIFLV